MKGLQYAFCFVWIMFVVPVCAQTNDLYFTNISVKDGLSQGIVYCIYQDKHGFTWFGTGDGVNRYDGYNFTIFKYQKNDTTTISNNLINCIVEDRSGCLWVGTGDGLNCYHPGTETFTRYTHQPSNTDGLSNSYVKSLLIDSKQRLWVGADGCLNQYDTLSGKFAKYDFDGLLKDTRIYCILEDSYGEMWLATRDAGLIRFNPETFRYKQYRHHATDYTSISANHVYTLYEDSNRQLWIGTWEQGINLYDRTNDRFKRIQSKKDGTSLNNNQIRCISENTDGTIWIGTFEGLNIFHPVNKTFKYCLRHNDAIGSLSYNIINCMFRDKAGSVWLGTYGGGVNLYHPTLGQFKLIDPKMKANHNFGVIGPMVEYGGKIWIGTEGGGLASYDLKSHDYKYFDIRNPDQGTLNSNTIRAMCIDHHHMLWIGTYAAGIQTFNPTKQVFEKYYDSSNGINNNIVNEIFEDSEGDIWVGSNYTEGLHVKDLNSDIFEAGFESRVNPQGIDFPWIRAICEPNNGELWFGSIYNGVYIYKRGETIQHISTTNSDLSSDYISVITEDSKSQIWIGTYGGGVNVYHPETGKITIYSTSNGLLNDNICSIIEDSLANVWISTMSGISRFNPTDGSFTNYSYQKSSFPVETMNLKAGLYASDGQLYFGGSNGLACFSPRNIVRNEFIPPVVFTSLFMNNKAVKPSDNTGILKNAISQTCEITLKYHQTNITVGFAALNYIFPQNNQYSSYLEGYEKNWNEAGNQRYATYTNLPPGKYTLKVKASNNDGVWSDNETQLVIRILPPPWKTWWAYTLYVVLFSGLLLAFLYYSLAKMRLENDVRLKQMEKQSMEQTHQMRINLFTNFSHELRTPLTLILDPLKNILADTALPSIYREPLNLVHKNAKRILLLVNQLMDFRKQESGKLKIKVSEGDIVKFIKEIVIIFGELAHPRGIRLQLHTVDKSIITWFDPFLLEKVFYNILSNAIKNTPDDGSIQVGVGFRHPGKLPKSQKGLIQLPKTPSYIEFIIKNTGKGIPADALQNIFDPFFQVAEHNAPGIYGTGIGLHIAKNIVEQHHGIIWAENIPGEGACFRIILPIDKSLFSPDEISIAEKSYRIRPEEYIEQQAVQPMERKASVQKHSMILVVDDNTDIRSYIKTYLVREFEVYEAENGEIGLQMAQQLVPDLIISDIMMPVMDGLELCRQLKNNVQTSHIPIVLLTARTTMMQIEEGLNTGADDYITKPFDAGLLKTKVHNLILNRKRLKEAYIKSFNVDLPAPLTSNLDEAFMTRAYDFVKQHIDNADLSIEEFGEQMHLSRTQLYRKIKALTGMSPSLFISTLRLKVAAELLVETTLTVSEIAYKVGFNNSSYFATSFKRLFGVSPTEYVGMKKKK